MEDTEVLRYAYFVAGTWKCPRGETFIFVPVANQPTIFKVSILQSKTNPLQVFYSEIRRLDGSICMDWEGQRYKIEIEKEPTALIIKLSESDSLKITKEN